jgi:hypothetical protein
MKGSRRESGVVLRRKDGEEGRGAVFILPGQLDSHASRIMSWGASIGDA